LQKQNKNKENSKNKKTGRIAKTKKNTGRIAKTKQKQGE
jgi:hypothetical protein